MNLRQRLQERKAAYKAVTNKTEKPKEKVKEIVEIKLEESPKPKKKKGDV
jgi:hypothetical protein